VPHLGLVDKARDYSCSNLASAVHKQHPLPTPTSLPVAVSRRRSPSRHAFASHPSIMIFETSSFKRRFQLRQPQQLHSVLLSCIFYCRSLATVTSLLKLSASLHIRFADVQHLPPPTRLRSNFCSQNHFLFFRYFSVASNFTIDDGLEPDVDKMMKRFVRRCRFAPDTDSVQFTLD
jgi:hypothetical protein